MYTIVRFLQKNCLTAIAASVFHRLPKLQALLVYSFYRLITVLNIPIIDIDFYKVIQLLPFMLPIYWTPCRSCKSHNHHGRGIGSTSPAWSCNRQLELSSCNCDHTSLIEWAKHCHGIKCWNGQQYIHVVDIDCIKGSVHHIKHHNYSILAKIWGKCLIFCGFSEN